MSIANVSGAALAALGPPQQSPGVAGSASDAFAQLLGGGGPLQMLQMLGAASPLGQMLQGSAMDAMSGQPDLDGDDDDDSDTDDDLV